MIPLFCQLLVRTIFASMRKVCETLITVLFLIPVHAQKSAAILSAETPCDSELVYSWVAHSSSQN